MCCGLGLLLVVVGRRAHMGQCHLEKVFHKFTVNFVRGFVLTQSEKKSVQFQYWSSCCECETVLILDTAMHLL